jgi:hypothetical protein
MKLSINSVRRAKWYAKLGFVRPQRPLCARLDAIKANSPVGAVDVIVERIYPILVYFIEFTVFRYMFFSL